MSSPSPLLVPFDGSEPSRHALTLARRLAAPTGRPVVLLYVGDELPELVREVVDEHDGVEVVVRPGLVEAVIAVEADARDAGLIVMGARGRSVLAGLVFGSTARAVLTACRRPTLVVHADTAARFEAPGHVVAAVESGPASPGIAANARAVATALGARLHLVTVMNVDRDLAARPRAYGIAPAAWQKGIDDLAAATFPRLTPGDGDTTRVLFGIPDVEIRRYADEVGAGIVACGRKGTTGTDIDAWRSVAFALASRGPFATLVV